MSFRTNPDRILAGIDRAKERAAQAGEDYVRQAMARELDSEAPSVEATGTQRLRRLFKLIERAYTSAAASPELKRLAARFQTIGDIAHHHARGDVTVSIHYMDSDRMDEVGLSPFEIFPVAITDAKKETRTSRSDVNALKVLRKQLRDGVMSAYEKIEPRLRDAVRERADMGHVTAQVTIDLRPGG